MMMMAVRTAIHKEEIVQVALVNPSFGFFVGFNFCFNFDFNFGDSAVVEVVLSDCCRDC